MIIDTSVTVGIVVKTKTLYANMLDEIESDKEVELRNLPRIGEKITLRWRNSRMWLVEDVIHEEGEDVKLVVSPYRT